VKSKKSANTKCSDLGQGEGPEKVRYFQKALARVRYVSFKTEQQDTEGQ